MLCAAAPLKGKVYPFPSKIHPRALRKNSESRRKKRKEKRAKRPALTAPERKRLRNHAYAVACSDYWMWLALVEGDEQGVNTKHPSDSADLFRAYEIYPPPAENTPMQACRCQRCVGIRQWPAYYIGSRGISKECEYDAMPQHVLERLQGSTSKINLARLKACRRRGEEYTGGF